LTIKDVPKDGDCQFHAIADQLKLVGLGRRRDAASEEGCANANVRLWCGMHAQGLRVPASAEDCGTARGRGGVQALPRWHLPVWTALSQLSSAAGRGWRVAPQVCDDGVSVRRRLP
jgi:hypothetical protein